MKKQSKNKKNKIQPQNSKTISKKSIKSNSNNITPTDLETNFFPNKSTTQKFGDATSPNEKSIINDEEIIERDYSKMDLVDLINQPAWKTILLDLVESEKMNPWDIDVIILTEKYLKKINELKDNNLRVPANAILACAILVKTKSKYLKLSSLEDEEEKEISLTEEQREEMLASIPDLMSERLLREGRITLDELVLSIENIIQRTNPKKNSTRITPKIEINFDSISIEEKLDGVFDLIKQKIDSEGIVLFKDLIDSTQPDEMIDVFLPVLFLMNKGKIIAYQNEFFGEIFIQLIKEIELNQNLPSDFESINPAKIIELNPVNSNSTNF